MESRTSTINEITAKLSSMLGKPENSEIQYAITENIYFFEAIKNVFAYTRWFFRRARYLDSSKLLELTDFPVPEWDIEMHRRLINLERKKIPGIIEPLVKKITEDILRLDRDIIIANLGSGGMEVDRQIIDNVLLQNFSHNITILGIDKSPTTPTIAKENLRQLSEKIDIWEVDEISPKKIQELRTKSSKKIIVILSKNDIFKLHSLFQDQYLDLIYTSLFVHHLHLAQRAELEMIAASISKKRYEYDGFRNLLLAPLQTLTSWKSPVFLNATIISLLRYPSRQELVEKYRENITFFGRTGHYMREY